MKSDTIGMSASVTKSGAKEIAKEAMEILASDSKIVDTNRNFSTIDMWNIQKRKRTSSQMRRWLN